MLFPKVDVRENLLSNGSMHGARIREQVDIGMSEVTRSKPALISLERAQNAMRLYKVDVARVGYTNGIEYARADKDDLLTAAGIALQALLMDGISAVGPLPALCEARDVLMRDIAAMQDLLTDQRAKREKAIVVMQPRMDLLDVLKHNIAQYELLRDAHHLHDAMRFADKQLAQRRPETALQIAKTGAESARNVLGPNHWFVAVMETRRVLAMFTLKQHDEVPKLAKRAIAIFEEWSYSAPEVDNAFSVDWELMRQAVAGQLVYG